MHDATIIQLVKFIPALPLVGFLIVGLFGKYLKKEAIIGGIASAAIGIAFVLTVIIFALMLADPPEAGAPIISEVFTWIAAGRLDVSIAYQVDQLSIYFALFITGVAFLIHVYSIGYMHGDRSFYRFFAYLNLFVFMMLNLVLANSFLLTFLGWEGVGLCSYLLIGFWYDKEFEGTRIKWTGNAGNKAFIVNRIGDFGFLIAMMLIFFTFGDTLNYVDVMADAEAGGGSTAVITAITLLLFLGATGKSAQIPLAVWLPDAMAGPTPVSALIHAATMVTGGVFLLARCSILFAMAPATMAVVAVVGTVTAIWAASIGLVQNDFKKVLAYSTVSQLGFMFAALGVGAFTAGVFHVMTHAFFKGLLFLAAGAVIHGMHDEQDIKKMGGLKKYMPTTYKTFLVATLAISGIPLFAGFFSKDEILYYVFSSPFGSSLQWLVLAVAAFFTAFYMFRLLHLVFLGEERFDKKHTHPHEAPKTMLIPLVVLAVLSALGGFLGVPYALGFFVSEHPNLVHSWLEPIFSAATHELHMSHAPEIHWYEYVLMLVSVGIALAAIYLAKLFYSDPKWSRPRKMTTSAKPIYTLLYRKYFVDEFYFSAIVDPLIITSRNFLWRIFDSRLIDGLVNGTAKFVEAIGQGVRRMQSGIAQNYALLMLGGIIAILLWLAFA